jgi:hypothetical protein
MRKNMDDRIAVAEAKVAEAKRRAATVQSKLNSLRKEVTRTERRKRAHRLIMMGSQLEQIGLTDGEQVGRFLAALRLWSFTDAATSQKVAVIDEAVRRAKGPAPDP